MKKVLIIIIAFGLLIACERGLTEFENKNLQLSDLGIRSENSTFSYKETYHKSDDNFRKLSKSLSKILESYEALRSIIKTEALLEFDGDNNILFEDLINRTLSGSDKTIGELIDIEFKKQNFTVSTDEAKLEFMSEYPNSNSAIQNLLYLYPSLNIGVFNVQKWDVSFIPSVAFIPENEELYGSIPSFKNNIETSLPASPEPTSPVIIIGLNERINITKRNTEPPIVDIQLTTDEFEVGILLSWDYMWWNLIMVQILI